MYFGNFTTLCNTQTKLMAARFSIVAEAVHAGIQATRNTHYCPNEVTQVDLTLSESFQSCMMALSFFIPSHDLAFLSLPVDISIAQCIAQRTSSLTNVESRVDGSATFFDIVAVVKSCLSEADIVAFECHHRVTASAPVYDISPWLPPTSLAPIQLRIQFEQLSLQHHSFSLFGSKPTNSRPSSTHVTHNGVLIPVSRVCRQFRHVGMCPYGSRCYFQHIDVEPHYVYSHNPYATHSTGSSEASSGSTDVDS